MPIIQPELLISDTDYSDYLLGKVEMKGLLRNVDNGQIVRHLDTVDSDEESTADPVALAIGAIVAITAVVAGVTVRLISKAKRKKVEEFKRCLNTYITAVNEQALDTAIIDNLIAAMDKLKGKLRKKVVVEFSTYELTALIECLCNHTQTMAQANSIDCDDNYTDEEKTDVLLRLRSNLVFQKKMFQDAA